MAEYWDVYNEQRLPSGKLHKRGNALKQGQFHLVVDIVVINTCAFIESAKGRNDVEITDLVAQWVSENKISSKSCRRGLWRLLHAYKLYNGTESNFNTAMRNKQ